VPIIELLRYAPFLVLVRFSLDAAEFFLSILEAPGPELASPAFMFPALRASLPLIRAARALASYETLISALVSTLPCFLVSFRSS